MKRAGLLFVVCLTFGSFGVHRVAAQAAQPVIPRAPVHAQMPGPNSGAASPRQVANKPPTHVPSVLPTQNPTSQIAKETDQTKIVRIYRGNGYFDAALAEKLRPILAKDSEPNSSSKILAPVDLLQTVLGGGDGSQKGVNQKSVEQKPVAAAGGL